MIDPFGQGSVPVERLAEIDSTNAEARRRAERGERGPLWMLAERQTAGRGRRGRSWQGGEGNLAATLLLALEKPPAEAALISFVAALAAAEALAAYAADDCVSIKWPNDVLLAGRKAAGILVESGQLPPGRPGDARGLWLAVGVGVNLCSAPEATERPATALAAFLRPGASAPPDAGAFLGVLSAAFTRFGRLWLGEGPGPILAAYAGRAAGLNGPCSVRLDSETLEGLAEGLEPDGALRVRLPGGAIRRITAGDVFFPPGAKIARSDPSSAGTG